ncbi:MAG: hypothetical protein ABJC61_10470 [Acidobacteriota bacterium]
MSAGDASADRASPVLIVTALREETDALIERARGVSRVAGAPRPAWRGSLSGQPVILARTGSGPANAAAGLTQLLRALGPCRWIGAGLAGALAPDIAVGQLLIAQTVRDADGTVAEGPDPEWAARALACAPGLRRARLVSSPRVAVTAREKTALRAGLEEGDAVDMESAGWARAAQAAGQGAPYLLARVVSDSAAEDLPEFLALSLAADGSLDRGRIARHAILRPAAIGKLLDLRRRARSCAGSLAEFLDRFAAAGF